MISKERVEAIRREHLSAKCSEDCNCQSCKEWDDIFSYIDALSAKIAQQPDAGLEVVGWIGAQIDIYGKKRTRLFTDENIAKEWSHFSPSPLTLLSSAASKIAELEKERDEMKNNYLGACQTIAKMHAAAVGEITGPKRGVVEDVEDVRSANEELRRVAGEVVRLAGLPSPFQCTCDSGYVEMGGGCDLESGTYEESTTVPCPHCSQARDEWTQAIRLLAAHLKGDEGKGEK